MRYKRLFLLPFPLCRLSLSPFGFNRYLLPYFAFPRFFFLLATMEKLINGANKQNETRKDGEGTATKTWEKSRDCSANGKKFLGESSTYSRRARSYQPAR